MADKPPASTGLEPPVSGPVAAAPLGEDGKWFLAKMSGSSGTVSGEGRSMRHLPEISAWQGAALAGAFFALASAGVAAARATPSRWAASLPSTVIVPAASRANAAPQGNQNSGFVTLTIHPAGGRRRSAGQSAILDRSVLRRLGAAGSEAGGSLRKESARRPEEGARARPQVSAPGNAVVVRLTIAASPVLPPAPLSALAIAAGDRQALQLIWQRAGARYGVPWQVLAAINRVESNDGRNLGPSAAGAVGWMQFLPSTWKRWGLDANGDGVADPNNPRDAIMSAARYLAAAGAQRDLPGALYAYNHAWWYVEDVLALARAYGYAGGGA